MRHLPRRFASLGAVALTLPILVIGLPVVAVVGSAIDLATGRRRLPTVRLWIFAIVFAAHEWVVAAYACWLWLRGGFGLRLDHQLHSRAQGRWVGSLLRWAGRLLDVRVEWPAADAFPPGRVAVLSRHASMVDAVLPAHLFPERLGRPVHYVLKRELRWLPSIDVYGHRLRNHFVDRSGDTHREVAAIERLVDRSEPEAGLVIFPEGTYATDHTRARVLASLERRGDDDVVALARELHHLLPPKPAGSLVLLDRCDHVVLFGHVGLEGVAELSGLRRHLPARRPIVTRTWTFAVDDLPADEAGRIEWLNDQWRRLDAWVDEQLADRR